MPNDFNPDVAAFRDEAEKIINTIRDEIDNAEVDSNDPSDKNPPVGEDQGNDQRGGPTPDEQALTNARVKQVLRIAENVKQECDEAIDHLKSCFGTNIVNKSN